MKKAMIVSFILLLTFSTALSVFSQEAPAPSPTPAPEKKELTAEEIVAKANHVSYYQGADGRAFVEMLVSDSQGRTRERSLTILRRNDDKENRGQKFYVFFDKPADVRNMVFLVWKNIDKDDDRWLYLPAMDLVKRIAASDKRTSFAGSDFFYEDVSGRPLKEDEHTLTATEEKFYIINNIPKDTKSVEFASYKVWIDKETFMPMKAEYLDAAGKKYRVMEVLETKTIQNFPTVTKSRISDLNTGSNTVMTFTDVQYDVGLPEDIFTERSLRRAPRKFLSR